MELGYSRGSTSHLITADTVLLTAASAPGIRHSAWIRPDLLTGPHIGEGYNCRHPATDLRHFPGGKMRLPKCILIALSAVISFLVPAADAAPSGPASIGDGWTPDPEGYADPQGIAFTKGKSDLVLCLMSGEISEGARRRADRSLLSYSGDTCRPRKTRREDRTVIFPCTTGGRYADRFLMRHESAGYDIIFPLSVPGEFAGGKRSSLISACEGYFSVMREHEALYLGVDPENPPASVDIGYVLRIVTSERAGRRTVFSPEPHSLTIMKGGRKFTVRFAGNKSHVEAFLDCAPVTEKAEFMKRDIVMGSCGRRSGTFRKGDLFAWYTAGDDFIVEFADISRKGLRDRDLAAALSFVLPLFKYELDARALYFGKEPVSIPDIDQLVHEHLAIIKKDKKEDGKPSQSDKE